MLDNIVPNFIFSSEELKYFEEWVQALFEN